MRARPGHSVATGGGKRFERRVRQRQSGQPLDVLDRRAVREGVGDSGDGVQVGEPAGVRGQPMLGVGELRHQVVQADPEPRLQLRVRLDRRRPFLRSGRRSAPGP